MTQIPEKSSKTPSARPRRFNALVMAGGRGTRMGPCGTEKPMQKVGGVPTVDRVISAISESGATDGLLVTVSGNTLETEKHLSKNGVETMMTSGEDFMMDLHAALSRMESDYVVVCSSDLPFLKPSHVSDLVASFKPEMESAIAVVPVGAFDEIDSEPSFTVDLDDGVWVLSGLSIVDRKKTLAGEYLSETFVRFHDSSLAMNVNTRKDLETAERLASEIRTP